MSDDRQQRIPGLDAHYEGGRWRDGPSPGISPVGQDTSSPGLREKTKWGDRLVWIQWVESYQSSGHTYGRYCFQRAPDPQDQPSQGITKIHLPGGSWISKGATANRLIVQKLIDKGTLPHTVVTVIKGFSRRPGQA